MGVVYWILVGAIILELIACLCLVGLLQNERRKSEFWQQKWIDARKRKIEET